MLDTSKDPDEIRKGKELKDANRVRRRFRKRARRARISHYFQVLFYTRRYKRKYASERPDYKHLLEELDTPAKAFAYVNLWVHIKEGLELTEPEDVVSSGISTQKGLVHFLAQVLAHNNLTTYIFWVGYSSGKIMPMCAVMYRDYEITIGPAYKVHDGGKDDMLHDYLEDGNKWIMMDRGMDEKIVSYDKFRTPQYMVHDEGMLSELLPNTYEVAQKLKMYHTLKLEGKSNV
jgi:hypothetical protein